MRTSPTTYALLLAAALATGACRTATPSPGPDVSLRDTDFRNFRYRFEDAAWTLVDGVEPVGEDEEWRYELRDVAYGDVTGDGREEAIVTITARTGGTMRPHWVFVYAAAGREPELLWALASGDRAAGGLKAVYADAGTLVVELLGKNMIPSRPETYGAEDDTSRGACCPSVFTRSRYQWNGRAFLPRGSPQVLPYDPDAA